MSSSFFICSTIIANKKEKMLFFAYSVGFSVSSVTIFFVNLSPPVAKVLQRYFCTLQKCPKALCFQGFPGTCKPFDIIPTRLRVLSHSYFSPCFWLISVSFLSFCFVFSLYSLCSQPAWYCFGIKVWYQFSEKSAEKNFVILFQ